MLAAGHPTLGSFNNAAKLTDATLALWARLLAADSAGAPHRRRRRAGRRAAARDATPLLGAAPTTASRRPGASRRRGASARSRASTLRSTRCRSPARRRPSSRCGRACRSSRWPGATSASRSTACHPHGARPRPDGSRAPRLTTPRSSRVRCSRDSGSARRAAAALPARVAAERAVRRRPVHARAGGGAARHMAHLVQAQDRARVADPRRRSPSRSGRALRAHRRRRGARRAVEGAAAAAGASSDAVAAACELIDELARLAARRSAPTCRRCSRGRAAQPELVARMFPPPPPLAAPPRISVLDLLDRSSAIRHGSRELPAALRRLSARDRRRARRASLAEGYNRAAAKASGDILVFSHDDIELVTDGFRRRLVAHLERYDGSASPARRA